MKPGPTESGETGKGKVWEMGDWGSGNWCQLQEFQEVSAGQRAGGRKGEGPISLSIRWSLAVKDETQRSPRHLSLPFQS